MMMKQNADKNVCELSRCWKFFGFFSALLKWIGKRNFVVQVYFFRFSYIYLCNFIIVTTRYLGTVAASLNVFRVLWLNLHLAAPMFLLERCRTATIHVSCIQFFIRSNLISQCFHNVIFFFFPAFPLWFLETFLFGFPEMWKEYLNTFLANRGEYVASMFSLHCITDFL